MVAQCPAVLEHLILVLLGVLGVESSLKPSKRRLTSDLFFNFLEDFQAVLYELCCLLREVIHFLSAHPEEGFPTEFVETSQTFPATHNRRRRRQFRPCVQYGVAARGVNFFLVSSHKDIPICAYSTRLCPVFCCSALSCNWPRTTYAAPKKVNTRTGIKRCDVAHNGSHGSRVACGTVASCPSPCKTLTRVERLAGFKVLVMSTDGAQPCSQPHGDGALEGKKADAGRVQRIG